MAKAKKAKRVVKRAVKKVAAKKAVKKRKGKILPEVPSKLIKLALKDLRKAEKLSHKYTIDMDDWYNPEAQLTCTNNSGAVVAKHKVCSVCFAGAVMAFSLPKQDPTLHLGPSNFNGNFGQLSALNSLRGGDVAGALAHMDKFSFYSDEYEKVRRKLNVDIPDYDALDPLPFHEAMEKFAVKLAKAGY